MVDKIIAAIDSSLDEASEEKRRALYKTLHDDLKASLTAEDTVGDKMEHEGTKLICGCGNGTFETYVEFNPGGSYDINSYCTVCASMPTDPLIKILGANELRWSSSYSGCR